MADLPRPVSHRTRSIQVPPPAAPEPITHCTRSQHELALNVCLWGNPAASVGNCDKSPDAYHSSQKLINAYLADCPLHQDQWQDMHAFSNFISRDPWDPGLVEDFDLRVLAASVSKYNPDNPS